MTTEQKTPEVRMTIEGHVGVISLDNTAKKNAITPALMSQLSAHLTTFEDDDGLWVAVLDPAGDTTAGLDMPKFFGPTATAKPIPKDQVDPFALNRRTTKPVISVVHGITYTIGIEMMLVLRMREKGSADSRPIRGSATQPDSPGLRRSMSSGLRSQPRRMQLPDIPEIEEVLLARAKMLHACARIPKPPTEDSPCRKT